jgi:formylglycine-generating enzyme required for sulfatase activity
MTISPSQANYLDSGIRTLVPVRTYTAPGMVGPFEVYELSGNVAEWVRDWYGDYPSNSVTNPEGPFGGTRKLLRGGSFYSSASGVRITSRAAIEPATGSREIGFRTAYTDPSR